MDRATVCVLCLGATTSIAERQAIQLHGFSGLASGQVVLLATGVEIWFPALAGP